MIFCMIGCYSCCKNIENMCYHVISQFLEVVILEPYFRSALSKCLYTTGGVICWCQKNCYLTFLLWSNFLPYPECQEMHRLNDSPLHGGSGFTISQRATVNTTTFLQNAGKTKVFKMRLLTTNNIIFKLAAVKCQFSSLLTFWG